MTLPYSCEQISRMLQGTPKSVAMVSMYLVSFPRGFSGTRMETWEEKTLRMLRGMVEGFREWVLLSRRSNIGARTTPLGIKGSALLSTTCPCLQLSLSCACFRFARLPCVGTQGTRMLDWHRQSQDICYTARFV